VRSAWILSLLLGTIPFYAGAISAEVNLYLEGRALYQRNCQICHGTTGRGNGPWAADMEHKPRNFRSGLFKFRSTPYGAMPVEVDLKRTIRNGISGTAMPAFTQLRDDELTALIAYLKQLSPRWKDPQLAAPPLALPKPPTWLATAKEGSAHLQRGTDRFRTTCAVCHGPNGKGDGPGGWNLIDAWGQPIRPADLTQSHPKSGDSPQDLYRTIATGLNGTPMPGFANQFPEEEIWELVAFLCRVR
jgi:mono/diheme cytochrome c family protein